MEGDLQLEIETINHLIGAGKYEDAYTHILDGGKSLPRWKMYRMCVESGLEGSGVKELLLWALMTLLVSFAVGPLDLKQLVSLLALFSRSFLYANYVSGFLGVLLGFFFAIGLLRRLYVTVLFPARLSKQEGRPIHRGRKFGALLLILLAAGSMLLSSYRAVPYLLDLPMALRGEYRTAEISPQEAAGRDAEKLMQTPSYAYEHKIMGDDLAKYKGKAWKYEYIRLGFPGINGRMIYIPKNGTVFVVNEIEANNLLYSEDAGHYLIQYLPHSNRVLQIRNWEEQES